MARFIQPRAKFHSMYNEGNRIALRVKIIDGPMAFLDRVVNVQLTFDEIERLHVLMIEAREHYKESQTRLDAMKAQEEDE